MTSASANWLTKFAHAARGLFWSLRTQKSFWVHLPVAVAVITLAAWLNVQPWRWCVLIIVISLVVSVELLNTAIEELTRVVHPQQDERIGHALDAAAAAVLTVAIAAVAVGLITLGVPLWNEFFPS